MPFRWSQISSPKGIEKVTSHLPALPDRRQSEEFWALHRIGSAEARLQDCPEQVVQQVNSL
jgi:hypothetical protein